jgi:hypothetical protein
MMGEEDQLFHCSIVLLLLNVLHFIKIYNFEL